MPTWPQWMQYSGSGLRLAVTVPLLLGVARAAVKAEFRRQLPPARHGSERGSSTLIRAAAIGHVERDGADRPVHAREVPGPARRRSGPASPAAGGTRPSPSASSKSRGRCRSDSGRSWRMRSLSVLARMRCRAARQHAEQSQALRPTVYRCAGEARGGELCSPLQRHTLLQSTACRGWARTLDHLLILLEAGQGPADLGRPGPTSSSHEPWRSVAQPSSVSARASSSRPPRRSNGCPPGLAWVQRYFLSPWLAPGGRGGPSPARQARRGCLPRPA